MKPASAIATSATTPSRRCHPGASHQRSVGAVFAAACGLALLALPATASAAPAAGSASFTFSGAVRGTLSEPNPSCSEIGGYGGQFSLTGKLKGSPAGEWNVNVNALGHKSGGTFKKFGGLTGNGVSIVLNSSGSTAYYWISKTGTLTTSATAGKVDVVLGPDQSFVGKPGKGTIHLKGSWGCQAA